MKAAARKTEKVAPPRPLWDLSSEVAPGFIRLTRKGKPVAYVLLASNYDEEDIATMTDASFWEMIRDRRKEDTGRSIPWDEVKAELVGVQPPARGRNGNGRKKEKRNASARD
jgi:hypothetical protein